VECSLYRLKTNIAQATPQVLHRATKRCPLQGWMQRSPGGQVKDDCFLGNLARHTLPSAITQAAQQLVIVSHHSSAAAEDLPKVRLELPLEVRQQLVSQPIPV
jgi:hypothetical protein